VTLIVIALALALLGCLLTLREWAAERRARIARCEARGHSWAYRSLNGEGVYWSRHCTSCPVQEPVAREEVPPHLRRAEPAYRKTRARQKTRARRRTVGGRR
jgi:hypothetical protein